MTPIEILATIVTQSKKQEWPYPKIFQTLINAGVASYKVGVADYDIVYQGNFGSWKEPIPEGFSHLKINTQFDEHDLIDAMMRRRNKETTYLEFLGQIAQAGVDHYVVSMPERTVTYYGIDTNNFYVQHIPQAS